MAGRDEITAKHGLRPYRPPCDTVRLSGVAARASRIAYRTLEIWQASIGQKVIRNALEGCIATQSLACVRESFLKL